MAEVPRAAGEGGAYAQTSRAVAVSIQDVVKSYGAKRRQRENVRAVDGVNLDIAQGELVVLLGPSGCGKTTLIRCIAGLERPTSGRIEIFGEPVFDAERRVDAHPEARNVGMVFQSYALWPHMTVRKNILFPVQRMRDSSDERERKRKLAQEVMDDLGIGGLGDRYPSQLSGGQQQRVAFARALIGRPRVLLFDEPLSNVDAKMRRQLRAQIRDLKREMNFCGVYVTHDQEEAMEVADRIAVMEVGSIRQQGSPRDVYDRPNSEYVATFVGETNRLPATVEHVDERGTVVRTTAGLLDCVASLPLAIGEAGEVLIRPEDLRLAYGDDVDPEFQLTGSVTEILFLGARVEVRLQREGTELLASLQTGLEGLDRLDVGESITLNVIPGKARWLPA
jgi:iron(III) transport system ATP-binding protein